MHNQHNAPKKVLVSLIALGAALAMPMAFAQDMESTDVVPEQESAQTTASAQQGSWADLDIDKDGQLSKVEASESVSLTAVFDEADADADGQLTADEYRDFHDANVAPETGVEPEEANEPAADIETK